MIDDFVRVVLNGPALSDVLKERIAQMQERGHGPDRDAEHPPHRLPDMAAQYARIAADRATPGVKQDLCGARKKAVQAAALALAAIQRIDAEIAAQASAMRDEGDSLADDGGLFGQAA